MVKEQWNRRLYQVLVLALAVMAGAAFLYARGWLRTMLDGPDASTQKPWKPPVIEFTEYDWEHPLLPRASKVDYRVPGGKGETNRLQVMVSSLLGAQEVRGFYDRELTARGWRKYSGSASKKAQTALGGMLFRKGDLSLVVHVFQNASGAGCRFRLGVVRMPGGVRSGEGAGAAAASTLAEKKE